MEPAGELGGTDVAGPAAARASVMSACVWLAMEFLSKQCASMSDSTYNFRPWACQQWVRENTGLLTRVEVC
ncbi:hypothetical protein B0919_18725 [Hymenobacter sp. CRA2]|nr:hypothetical protein B0919_18725 [Hymenobacter sp. CRA2]